MLTFAHQLAKVRVTPTGDALGEVQSLQLYTYTQCTYEKGTVVQGSQEGWIEMMPCTYTDNGTTITCWEANVVPGYEITKLMANNDNKERNLSAAITPEAGKFYNITLNYDPGYTIEDDGSYTVYTANGLLAWNEAAQSDYTLNCTLTENINLTGKEWTPVGNSFQTYNGTFDGQGYSITGLNASSLFGGIGESATVKNLQLVDVKLNESSGATAGIVVNNYGTIMACSMTGEISAYSFTSGIANFNLGTIVACWFSGTLKENEGYGIVAFNYGTITACFWDGNTTNGYRSNEGGTVDATKVEGTTTWQNAVAGMNAALTDNAYQWTSGTDGLPVLKKK